MKDAPVEDFLATIRVHIVLHTVKSHMHNVLDKLALHTRLQVAAYAHREGDAES